ncbi:MAG TPA: dihydroorotate dehydrogenase electron transfer subunit, partial [Bacillota bacterium]|nr:dihydroorotate dehydrogenase electron transfer subunit [Bacillota bacterium]
HSPAQPLLRRPFSIYDIDSNAGGSVTILYGVRGAGTLLLTNARPGDCLDVMGPLGRGFTLPESQSQSQSQPHSPARSPHALLIGGGLGIAPLVFLARTLARAGCRATVLYGANTASQMQPALLRLQASRAESVRVFTTTLDGSAGLAGIVTDLLTAEPLAAELGDIDSIYTCGPEPMMAAVEQFALARRIRGEMSLETSLACGVGACLGCARRLKAGPGASPVYARVCKDGPVFSFGQVELNPIAYGEE